MILSKVSIFDDGSYYWMINRPDRDGKIDKIHPDYQLSRLLEAPTSKSWVVPHYTRGLSIQCIVAIIISLTIKYQCNTWIFATTIINLIIVETRYTVEIKTYINICTMGNFFQRYPPSGFYKSFFKLKMLKL